LLTAQFYSPAEIIMIDMDDNRLQTSRGEHLKTTRCAVDAGRTVSLRSRYLLIQIKGEQLTGE